jgi:type I restriction enzyme S subunit
MSEPMTFGAFMTIIRTPYNSYLRYFFDSSAFRNQIKGSATTTINQITRKMLDEIEVPVFDVESQIRITTQFEKLSKLIAMRKEQLAKLDELVKARFVEMFGDSLHNRNTVSLEEISDFVTVGIANSATHAYADSGIVMLRNQNIKENYLDDNDLIYITPDFAKKYGSKQLAENDILVIRTGYPGVACLVPKKYEGCQTFTTLIVRLKNSTPTHTNYVCHYINSSFGKGYVEQSKVGVAQQNFGAKALAKMPIAVPPMELQEQFAAFVEQTNKTKLTIQASLDKLEVMKKALMQEYFG